ncbi:uncharacterized protein cubi_01747 [Cryptosporidium ubiquitum]|uniref:Beta-Casp domain-containing protein n=1 Tax=Cryptosporidium ubiquitum TaxID=857276 RepID=A0A1J4MAL6_9CRYT|nr:uncharacterized protein cubi_01747 [Cryptosporidium ubiquitum]OII71272.1 hypothetical protein cubi_01747 [Cryptosporidium ubiquitum]
MEVFFSPIKIDDKYKYSDNNNENIKFKSYQNFAFIKFYDLNILCDCPLVCKNDLNFNHNQELFKELNIDQLHEDTLFPATFLFNEFNTKENEKIEIDLILISNPHGLIGIPFLLHYNHYCNYLKSSNLSYNDDNINSTNEYNGYDDCDNNDSYCNYDYDNNNNQYDIDHCSDDSHSDDENNKNNYLNIYQWLDKYPSKFDITNSKLLVTPPVYQSTILSLQQLIEYYSNNPFNNIIDPFIWLKTPDLYNIISSDLINNSIDIENGDSLKIRHKIFSNLPENGPEYYYNQFSFNDNENNNDSNNFNSIIDSKNTNSELINSRGSTTGLGAAINAASHIFDGNILQNIPTTIGCNTSNSNTSHPPVFGKVTGEEMSYLPRSLIENKFINSKSSISKDINSNFISNENSKFEIKLIHIGEITHKYKNFSKFNIHAFDSGFCLGGVGFHISTNNIDFDVKKTIENLTIIGPVSLEFDRYPAPLYLGDLLNSDNLVFYGNFCVTEKTNKCYNINEDKKDEIKSSILPGVAIKDIDKESKNESDIQKSIYNSISYQTQLDNIIQHISDTLNKNGSILIPIDCFGLLCLEVVEFIGQKISELITSVQVPMYIIGGGISTILLNADISSEWTSQSRTRKVMLPNPNPPFLFSFLKKFNRLYTFHTIDELSTVYREPAIFFATNSNMKFGPSYDLFKTLNNNPNNALIIIDSLVDFEEFVHNFEEKPIMNIIHSPIYIEPNIYHLIENIIPYFNQNKEKFNFIMPHNNKSDFILYNNQLSKDENFITFQSYIKLIPITNKIIYNKHNQIFDITGNWIPVTLSSEIADNTELKQINPNLFVGKTEAVFNYVEGQLLIEKKNSNNSNDSNIDISEINHGNDTEIENTDNNNLADCILMVDDFDHLFDDFFDYLEYELNNDQQILFGNITIKTLIKEFKDRRLDEIFVNYNDFFQEEKVTSISIQSINCKIIIYSSNNFIINSNNRESRELVCEIISSLLTSV